jgi:uncharacterized membrane protein (DUF4010 family)
MAIMLAWVMMFARILVIVAVWNVNLLRTLAMPMLGAAGAALIYGLYLLRNEDATGASPTNFNNPFNLRQALLFGVIYAVILVAARAAQMYFGDSGIYVSAALSGLATVDAITISLADLSATGTLPSGLAARGIVIAALANTFAKGLIVVFSGSAALRRAILPGALMVAAAAVALSFLG